MIKDLGRKVQTIEESISLVEAEFGISTETIKMRSHLEALAFMESEAIIEVILDTINLRCTELLIGSNNIVCKN